MFQRDNIFKTPDEYDLLGISVELSTDEISHDHYKKALLKWGGKFARQIVDAFDKLRKPESRIMVDIFYYQSVGKEKIRVIALDDLPDHSVVQEPFDIGELTHLDEIDRY